MEGQGKGREEGRKGRGERERRREGGSEKGMKGGRRKGKGKWEWTRPSSGGNRRPCVEVRTKTAIDLLMVKICC